MHAVKRRVEACPVSEDRGMFCVGDANGPHRNNLGLPERIACTRPPELGHVAIFIVTDETLEREEAI